MNKKKNPKRITMTDFKGRSKGFRTRRKYKNNTKREDLKKW